MKSYSTVRELAQGIVDTRAQSVIEMMIDNHLERADLTEDEKWLLNAIKGERLLDRQWMLCYTFLGNYGKAEDIRLFLLEKEARKLVEKTRVLTPDHPEYENEWLGEPPTS